MITAIFIFLLFIASAINIFARGFTAIVLKILYTKSKITIQYKRLYEAVLISHAVNFLSFYGTGSVLVRPYVINKTSKVAYAKSVTISIIEHAFETFSSLFALAFSIFFIGFQEISPLYNVVSIVAAFTFLFIIIYVESSLVLIKKALSVTKFLPTVIKSIAKKAAINKDNLIETIGSIQKSKGKGRMIFSILLLDSLVLFVDAISPYAFFLAMGVNINYFQAFALYWLPFFIGRVSSIPGGIGVREGAMAYLLTLFGVALPQAIVLAVSYRLVLITLPLMAGLILSLRVGFDVFKFKKK
jgi:uncharacterized protein (TIRG00374 family)